MVKDTSIKNVGLELRRGVIVLAVLSHLRQEGYGYSVLKSLSEKGLEIDQGTLYPLLRRLESQGWLQSDWRVESDRPRRYYALSSEGEIVLQQLTNEWKQLVGTINNILKE